MRSIDLRFFANASLIQAGFSDPVSCQIGNKVMYKYYFCNMWDSNSNLVYYYLKTNIVTLFILLLSSTGDLDWRFSFASAIHAGVEDGVTSLVETGTVAVTGILLFGSGTLGLDRRHMTNYFDCFDPFLLHLSCKTETCRQWNLII